jgi:hypothetical protein
MKALVLIGLLATALPCRAATVDVDVLWNDLASEDATRAFRAIRLLEAVPEQAVALIRARVKPAVAIEPAKLERWIAELDGPQFTVRRAAYDNLIGAGLQAEPPVRRALAASPSLEVRRRLETLLDRQARHVLTGKELQAWRATEVLETIGTPEARQLLQSLARGAPGDRVTEEASGCLTRLARKNGH